MARNKHMLCVFSYILGGNTFSKILEEITESLDAVDTSYIKLDSSTYARYPPPRLARLGNNPESFYLYKKLYAVHFDTEAYDAVMFQSYHACLPVGAMLATRIGLLFLDSTPALDYERQRSVLKPTRRLGKYASLKITNGLLQQPFQDMDHFYARTELVKRSLVTDYEVNPSRITVTYAPAAVNGLRTAPSNHAPKRRLLFVGNDFARKGGPFLLDVYRHYLASLADLVIVSDDAGSVTEAWPPSVGLYSNLPRSEVLELMRCCDIFVFPTWNDTMGLVLAEAVQAGMAIVSRNVSCQSELVANGRNGFLMARDSGINDWGDALLKLCGDDEALHQAKQASAELSSKLLSQDELAASIRRKLRLS